MSLFNSIWQHVPGIVRHDFMRKIIALFLAGILCYAVRDKLKVDDEYSDIPVIVTPPVGMVNLDRGGNLRANVKFRRSKYRKPGREEFKIVVSGTTENYRKGKGSKLLLTPRDVKAPMWVNVLSVSPTVVPARFSRLETRDIPVKPVFFPETPMKGFALLGCRVTPEKIRVTAPDTLINSLELRTLPIPLDKARVTFEDTAEIDRNPLPENVMIGTNSVKVSVEIGEEKTNREFQDIPVNLLTKGSRRKARLAGPPVVTIVVNGPKKALDRLKDSGIKPYVDVSRVLRTGTHYLPVECFLSDGLDVQSIKPSEMKVEIFQ